MLDMHCHILPGVDDGSRSMSESVAMLRGAKAAGVSTIVATPHVYSGAADLSAMRAVREALGAEAAALGLRLLQGYEVNYAAFLDFPDIASLAVEGTDCVLIELPGETPFPDWLGYLRAMRGRCRPIVAHPERVRYIRREPELAGELLDIGCELQVSADALALSARAPERQAAQWLLREGLAQYIASDAHRPSDYEAFETAWRKGEWRAPRGRLHEIL